MKKNKISLENKFEEELNHQRSRRRKARVKQIIKVFVVVLFVVSVLVYSVEEWRVGVMNFFRDRTEEYTEIKFTEDPVSSYSVNGITLNYIPEGYRLVGDYSEIGEYTSLEFQDEKGSVMTFKHKKIKENYTKKFDTENAVVTEFDYRGCKAIKSIKDEIQVLVWFNSEEMYTLMCSIGEDELMKIADNIDF